MKADSVAVRGGGCRGSDKYMGTGSSGRQAAGGDRPQELARVGGGTVCPFAVERATAADRAGGSRLGIPGTDRPHFHFFALAVFFPNQDGRQDGEYPRYQEDGGERKPSVPAGGGRHPACANTARPPPRHAASPPRERRLPGEQARRREYGDVGRADD